MTDVTPRFKAPKKAPRRRAWNSTLPASSKARSKKKSTGNNSGVTPEMRRDVYRRANGRCQAVGLHHKNCPGKLPALDWSAHHVHTRQHGGPDTLDNLIAVWCPGGLGLNGCHGKIHGYPAEATRLGLLSRG